jgi:cell fate (sporulation/competence/biofilm development) regulator YmcA (YheA/YmcA/DUF963 family)
MTLEHIRQRIRDLRHLRDTTYSKDEIERAEQAFRKELAPLQLNVTWMKDLQKYAVFCEEED